MDTLKALTEHCEYIRDRLEFFLSGGSDEEHEDIYDYVHDNLGGKKVVDLSDPSDLRGVILTMACGGPNIYIDTYEACIRGYWGSQEAKIPLRESICIAIDECFL